MSQILLALAPVFLLILSGYAIKRNQLIHDGFWEPAEWMTYYIFFPALLVNNIGRADLGELEILPMAGAIVAAIGIIAAIVLISKPWLKLSEPTFTSVFQGSIRPNTYVGFAGAAALHGDLGVTLMSVCIVVGVPLVNLLSVGVLVRFAGRDSTPAGWREMLLPILKNPLILGCLAGAALNASGLGPPPVIGPMLEILGRASLPIALLAVGAGLNFTAVSEARGTVAATSALKLLGLPLAMAGTAAAFGLNPATVVVCMVYASLPGSTSSYVLARQMGGDAPLLAGTITATTLAAMISMPLIILAVR